MTARLGLMPELTCYSAFGLQLTSDLVLPELPTRTGLTTPSVSVQVSHHSEWPPLESSPHSTPTLQLAPGEWRLQLEGIGWFRASDGQTLEWQRWDDSVSDRDLRTFLVTSGLGALAIQRGDLVLHGTALERAGQAVLLLGHPATGKSTLAWCLAERGWQLLSSELVVVDSQGLIWPGLQQIKLWHDAAVGLGVDWQQLPPVRRGLKRYAALPPTVACADQPVPLRCLYALHRTKGHAGPSGQITDSGFRTSSSMTQQQALLRLRNQAFHARAVRGMAMEAGLFTQAAALARMVPMYRLEVPYGITAMADGLEDIDLLDPASLHFQEVERTDG